MEWGTDVLRAEMEYRRYGTAERAAWRHLDELRRPPARWRRVFQDHPTTPRGEPRAA